MKDFMRMVLISGQCDSVSKDVVLKKRKVQMKAKQNIMQYGAE